jgi:hypothetical protein
MPGSQPWPCLDVANDVNGRGDVPTPVMGWAARGVLDVAPPALPAASVARGPWCLLPRQVAQAPPVHVGALLAVLALLGRPVAACEGGRCTVTSSGGCRTTRQLDGGSGVKPFSQRRPFCQRRPCRWRARIGSSAADMGPATKASLSVAPNRAAGTLLVAEQDGRLLGARGRRLDWPQVA